MNVCIIGSSGFLAESLIDYCLDQSHQITVWGRKVTAVHPSVTFLQKDFLLDEIEYTSLSKFDAVFYCVANGVQSSVKIAADDIFYINTFVPIKIIENLKAIQYTGVFFTFGSYFEIGNESDEIKYYTERDIVFADNPVPNTYCLSKRLLTRYVYGSKTDFTYYHCVLPTIYGLREQAHRLIPHIINCVINHLNISLTSGIQVRQYLWVEDLVTILFAMIDKKIPSSIYNLPASQTLSVKDIAVTICQTLNYDTQNINIGNEIRKDESMKSLKLSPALLKSHLTLPPLTTIQQFVQANNRIDDK